MDEITACDRVIVMKGGHIVLTGTPEEVFGKTDILLESNLVPPEAVLIRDSLKEAGYSLSDRVLTAEQLADELCPLL